MLRAALVLGALALSSAAPRAAFADRPNVSAKERAKATDLKTKGDAAMVALRYGEAIELYTEAYSITEDPALLYNRGRALQGLERFPEALAELSAFNEKASPKLKARVPALDALINEVRSKVTRLSITCNVSGARILVRSKVVGKTPLSEPLPENAGPAVIEVEAEGWFPFKRSLDLPGGKELAIEATLLSKSSTGILIVRSPVAGARVFIDGKSQGNVPVEAALPQGSHTIVVDHEGYDSAETTAIVQAGDRNDLSIPLDKSRPLATRWWFWAGVGVVVVGGVLVTSAMLIEGPASRGDIPPGQVSAPLRF